MTRLFIEDKELDITEDFSHQITYAIDDLNYFDSKSTAFTKTIILAGTSNNNKLLGNIFEFANANFTDNSSPNVYYNFNASKSAKARIEINGLMAMKGILRLLQINIDQNNVDYEIALFGELGGFVSKLGAKKITDNDNSIDNLDFSTYNHNYNVANIIATWQDTITYTITYSTTFTAATKTIRFNRRVLNLQVGAQFLLSGTASNNNTFTIVSIFIQPLGLNKYTEVVVEESVTNETDSSFTLLYYILLGTGYIYPLIDYGAVSYDIPSTNPTYLAKKDYQFRAFRPAFYLREYLLKIIENAGYTYESDFIDSAFFRRLIIPNNDKELYRKGVNTYIDAIDDASVTYSPSNTPNTLALTGTTLFLNGFTYSLQSTYYGNVLRSLFCFSYTNANNSGIQVNLNVTGTYNNAPDIFGGNQNVCKIAIYRARGFTETLVSEFNMPSTTQVDAPFNINLIGTTDVNQTDKIIVYVICIKATSSGIPSISKTYSSINVTTNPPIDIQYQYGEDLIVNDFLPKNILQKDFFTSVLKMFNLMVTEDKFIDKHLVINPWVDFYNLTRSSYIDWSDKIDRSNVIKISPMSEVNSRYYTLKYKDDTDYYNERYKKQNAETYGTRTFDNQLEFAKDSSVTEVIFAPTPLVGYQNRDKVVSTIFKLNNNAEETTPSIIRVLQVKVIDSVTSWKILNQSAILSTQTNYCYAGHLNNPDLPSSDLNFGATKELYFSLVSGALSNNLFNTYYSSYLAEITDKDSRLVTAKIKLIDKDIFNLDFGRFIWFDGVLYRLIKIVDYSEGELCEVQLLRVIYTTYL